MVARVETTGNAHRNLVEKPEEKTPLERPKHR